MERSKCYAWGFSPEGGRPSRLYILLVCTGKPAVRFFLLKGVMAELLSTHRGADGRRLSGERFDMFHDGNMQYKMLVISLWSSAEFDNSIGFFL